MARKKRNPDAEKLAESILNTYQPESVEDMQDVLKDVFGPLFEKMLQGELNNHLGMTPILKSQRNMTIDETVMAIRRLKRALVK
ncbi:hypothetical protein KE480_14780 [Enterococcus sp. 079]|nr:hypothetical protein [Enterococcus sp. 079]